MNAGGEGACSWSGGDEVEVEIAIAQAHTHVHVHVHTHVNGVAEEGEAVGVEVGWEEWVKKGIVYEGELGELALYRDEMRE